MFFINIFFNSFIMNDLDRDFLTPQEVKSIRKSLHLTQKQFATKLGVALMTIGNWEKGSNRVPGTKVELIRKLQANSPQFSLNDEKTPKYERITNFIPLLRGGQISKFDNNIISDSIPAVNRYSIPEFKQNGVEFLLRMPDLSMTPRFFVNDIIGCKKVGVPSFLQWGRVYVIDTKQGAMVRKVFQNDENSYLCKSENSIDFPDVIIEKEQVLSFSIVLASMKFE